jgi:hypothetical protein
VLPAYVDRFLIDDKLLADEPSAPIPFAEESTGDCSEIDAAEPVATSPSATPRARNTTPPITPPSYRHGHSTRAAAGVGERALAVATICERECFCDDCTAAEPTEVSLAGLQGDASSLVALPSNPRSMTETLRGPQSYEWRLALEKERDSSLETHSYVEVKEKPERFVGAVMALRVSRKTDGTLKFRARLCPNGGGQVRGKDYDDSYSPTTRKETILMVMHVAGVENWDLEHLDVANAYKETLTDDRHPLHMKLSQSMIDFGFAKSAYVRLNVNYWGTKEAGQRWHAFISFIIGEFGMRRSGDDPCQFELYDNDSRLVLLILIYVDDVLITGSSKTKIAALKEHIQANFTEIKCEELARFVGMQITRDRKRREIYVHLTEYAQDIVARLVPDHVLGTTTPLYSTVDYRAQEPGEEKPIWGEVGMLRFLADSSWWDLKVASALLASAGATPNKAHRRGAMKCLQYVKEHQSDHTLVLGGKQPVVQYGYTDAFYTPEGDSRYLFGFALFLSPTAGPYTVRSKRSTTVSHSSV